MHRLLLFRDKCFENISKIDSIFDILLIDESETYNFRSNIIKNINYIPRLADNDDENTEYFCSIELNCDYFTYM